MSTFTPGPWFDISDEPKGRDRMPCMAMVSTSCAGSRQAIDCTGSGKDFAEDCANARLIAAAPEMLEALKLAQMVLTDRCAFAAVLRVIVKATGEQS